MSEYYYSLNDVCRELGITEEQVKDLVRGGEIREFRDAGQKFYRLDCRLPMKLDEVRNSPHDIVLRMDKLKIVCVLLAAIAVSEFVWIILPWVETLFAKGD